MADQQDSASPEKRCTVCGEVKLRTEFYAVRARPNGVRPACKECCKAATRASSAGYYQAHKDEIKAASLAYYQANRAACNAKRLQRDRDNKGDANARKAAWAQANREKVRIANREWTARNYEHVKAKNSQWNRANPEKLVARSLRFARNHPQWKRDVDAAFHASRRAAPGRGVSRAQWTEVRLAAVGMCCYCGKTAQLTMDHIDPIAKGGEHDVDNIAACCRSCNSSKNDTTLLVWLARRALGRAADRAVAA